MKLGEKLRYLREVEGNLRGLDRAMTQLELVRAIKAELGTERGAAAPDQHHAAAAGEVLQGASGVPGG